MAGNTETFIQSGQALVQSLDGQTLCTVLQRTAQRCGAEPAYSDRLGDAGALRTLTWHAFRQAALDAAGGLIAHGIAPGALVAVMASNRIEHVVSDAAILHAGCIPVPIYVTASPKQVRSIAAACAPTAVIVENADHLTRFKPALDELDHVTHCHPQGRRQI